MKKLVKRLTKGLVLAGVLGLGVLIGLNINKTEKVEVARIVTESREGIYIEQGEQFIELTDGSFIIYGNGNYIFQPVEMGDWDYEVDNAQQLENIVKTYMSMKNNGWY